MSQLAEKSRRHVPTALHWQARFFERTAGFWKRLAGLESAVLREEIDAKEVDRPIYVAGVPRAGSTILTELLSRHPSVTSHRYSDFPNVYTPYWRNWLSERSRRRPAQTVERAHRDRIKVSNESPEAFEEVIWMRFFDNLHTATANQALDESVENRAFETFYRDHIRKLLLVRNRSRYLAKGNYNTTRLPYIRKLFPDARFIVPVRNPVNQVASLIKQDRLFDNAQQEDPRVERQLRMSGHFEFGPDRKPVRLDDSPGSHRILQLWQSGERVAGWAHYWQAIYDHVLGQIDGDNSLRQSVYLLRYEDFCRDPDGIIRKVLEHLQLDVADAEPLIAHYAARISEPDYYRPDFSEDELSALVEITQRTATALGYDNLKEQHE